ncbi:uncharacterized protein C6orf136 homolog [Spea bombifrons]|uniref:uncharacterized protein C6orf136 homolog n=1 Tax=Spea bombifrons TaxID=233779 RepID=UPI00234971A9|nr:uncharacterized protein C6orf136 homolog [Spea bombifrons]
MALCVRRLRGAPGLGSRWRNGVRGAGGAAGRPREGSRASEGWKKLRDVTWSPELSVCQRIPVPQRRPFPPKASSALPPGKPRIPYPLGAGSKALRGLHDVLEQNKGHLLPPEEPSPPRPFPHPAYPLGGEYRHLSSAQLDCFRSLFEPGVCRTPYHQAAAPPAPGRPDGVLAFQLSEKVRASPSPGGSPPDMEQHLALMHAKLREDLPKFLLRNLDYSVYRKDVEFVSSVLHIRTRGLVLYQLLLSLSRLLFLSYFSNTRVSVLKLTTHPETCSIQARWSVSGLPMHSLFFYVFRSDKSELYRTYDAHSTFYLASDGLICLHKLERVMPSEPLAVPKKTILAAALIALGLGEDRPALNLLFSCKIPHKL